MSGIAFGIIGGIPAPEIAAVILVTAVLGIATIAMLVATIPMGIFYCSCHLMGSDFCDRHQKMMKCMYMTIAIAITMWIIGYIVGEI